MVQAALLGVTLLLTAGCQTDAAARAQMESIMDPVVGHDAEFAALAAQSPLDRKALRALCGQMAKAAWTAHEQLADSDWPSHVDDEAFDLTMAVGMYAVWLDGCSDTESDADLVGTLDGAAEAVPDREIAALERALSE